MSLFDLFKKSNRSHVTDSTAGELARRQTPESRRLSGLKSYRDLSKSAQTLVRRVILDGQSAERARNRIPNGKRLWESMAVQRCLEDAGWIDPKSEPEAVERAMTSPASHDEPINEPREEPKNNGVKPEDISLIPQERVSTCEVEMGQRVCGLPSAGQIFGKNRCAHHASIALGHAVELPAPEETAETKEDWQCSEPGCTSPWEYRRDDRLVCHAHALPKKTVDPSEGRISGPGYIVNANGQVVNQPRNLDPAIEFEYDSYRAAEMAETIEAGQWNPFEVPTGRDLGTFTDSTGFVSVEDQQAQAREAAHEAQQRASQLADAPHYRRNR